MIRPSTASEPACHGPRSQVVILGASARALAASAVRAGWDVYAGDLFTDLDLEAIATAVTPVANGTKEATPDYPWSLLTAAAGFPPAAAWCYTGAIENHPDFIDAIASVRPLAGNTGDIVRRLRDPMHLTDAAQTAGLSFPETLASPEAVPLDGTFVVKPLASAGGRGIRRWTPAVAADHASQQAITPGPARMWQRFVAGTPLSASYCFTRGSSRLLGASRQLIGEPWCHAGMFAWCGAVSINTNDSQPAHERLVASLTRLGDVLASRFEPVGLVGVDFVFDTAGHITMIEVNPRLTASMELFERLGTGSIAGSHFAACGLVPASSIEREQPPIATTSTWSKAVLFASRPTPVTQPLIDALMRETSPWTMADGGWPALADIPRPGQTIPAGAPVVTIFAAGLTCDDAVTRLRDRVARIDALLLGLH